MAPIQHQRNRRSPKTTPEGSNKEKKRKKSYKNQLRDVQRLLRQVIMVHVYCTILELYQSLSNLLINHSDEITLRLNSTAIIFLYTQLF